MLVRHRLSRIYFLRRFFDYPSRSARPPCAISASVRTVKIGASYASRAARQIKPERTLQDFMINRFGRELYETFFKDYTEKVWGVPCDRDRAGVGRPADQGRLDLEGASPTPPRPSSRATNQSARSRPRPV